MVHKILLVEDNELNRDMLSRRLQRKGFEVTFALDGREGLDKISSERPDLVLMDIGLPIMDGWEAIAKAKTDQSIAAIPIIALTAHALEAEREKALTLGAEDFDTKPVDFKRLLAKISLLLDP